MNRTWYSLASLLLATATTLGQAQDSAKPDDPNAPEIIELTLLPAGEPRPALKYRLTPATAERTPGNAAPYYFRSVLHLNNLPKEHWKKYDDNQETWLSSDPAVFPK